MTLNYERRYVVLDVEVFPTLRAVRITYRQLDVDQYRETMEGSRIPTEMNKVSCFIADTDEEMHEFVSKFRKGAEFTENITVEI